MNHLIWKTEKEVQSNNHLDSNTEVYCIYPTFTSFTNAHSVPHSCILT